MIKTNALRVGFTFVNYYNSDLFTFVFYLCEIIIYICNYEFERKNFRNY